MVKAYFTACEQAFPAHRAQMGWLSPALCRSGAEQLCPPMSRTGGTVRTPLHRGKSLPLISAVCVRYEENRTSYAFLVSWRTQVYYIVYFTRMYQERAAHQKMQKLSEIICNPSEVPTDIFLSCLTFGICMLSILVTIVYS